MEKLPTKDTENETCHLLKEDKVARWLNVSTRTLQNWRWRGGGPEFIKLRHGVRYEPAAVEAWISARTRGSTSAPDSGGSCNVLDQCDPLEIRGGKRS